MQAKAIVEKDGRAQAGEWVTNKEQLEAISSQGTSMSGVGCKRYQTGERVNGQGYTDAANSPLPSASAGTKRYGRANTKNTSSGPQTSQSTDGYFLYATHYKFYNIFKFVKGKINVKLIDVLFSGCRLCS